MAINVQVLCDLEPVHLEPFSTLLSELVGLVGPDRVTTLSTIFVVDSANVQDAVRAVIQTVHPTASYTSSPTFAARGVAVPIEQNGQLVSTIVLARELIEPLVPPLIHPHDTVSTVLEELLHVCIYESTWRRRGYVQHRSRDVPGCEADVLRIISQMSDEYVVNRWKANLAATRPLFDCNGGLVAGELQYGGSVVDSVRSGIEDITTVVTGARSGVHTITESWSRAVARLYRGILEPLARDAAYADGNGSTQSLAALMDVPQFAERVSDLWQALHNQMRRMYDTDLLDTETLLPIMTDAVRSLLGRFGVEYERLPGGTCYVRLDDPAPPS